MITRPVKLRKTADSESPFKEGDLVKYDGMFVTRVGAVKYILATDDSRIDPSRFLLYVDFLTIPGLTELHASQCDLVLS